MKKNYLIIAITLSTFFASCSSMEDDAKNAADLSKESLNYVRSNQLDKAKDAYDKSQAIINQYKETEQYQEFYKAYNSYFADEVLDK